MINANAIEAEESVLALMAQDSQTFQALVKVYHVTMLHLARSIVGDSIAEEVVQEAWLSVYSELPKFERRSGLKTWIYRIVSNKAISRLRKESRSVSFSELGKMDDFNEHFADRFAENGQWLKPPGQWHDETPETLFLSKELSDCIDHISGQLPKLQHAVFIFKDIEGKTMEEICNILDISASNMRVLLHRARLKLFDHVDHFQETGEC